MKIAKFMTDKSLASVLLLTVFFITSLYQAKAQGSGTFTDPRDGETYITIKVPNKKVTWMAQNLRWRMDDGSWSYNGLTSAPYYKQFNFGRLYTWYAAIKACPAGWRLPSDTDWDILISAFGGEENGSAFKSTIGWENGGWGNGSNTSGFSGLPGGRVREGYEQYLDDHGWGFWWSSSDTGPGSGRAYYRNLVDVSRSINRTTEGKSDGMSVRCLRDD